MLAKTFEYTNKSGKILVLTYQTDGSGAPVTSITVDPDSTIKLSQNIPFKILAIQIV